MDAPAPGRQFGPPRSGIAERIWDSARSEFSRRGYHGARVQGIARGAACNVALMYRHWASKRALYADILRAVWIASANEIARRLEDGSVGADAFVVAYVDAMTADPVGAQILIREYLDGAPFLAQLAASDPSIVEPLRRAAATLRPSAGGIDPTLTLVTVGGVAALVASTREAARPFSGGEAPEPEAWRRHVLDLLVYGLSRSGATSATDASETAGRVGSNGTSAGPAPLP